MREFCNPFQRAALIALLGASTLAGCQRTPDQTAPAVSEAAQEIAWFSGSLEQALAASAAQQKPVFLYWGAEWCPPCHDLKAHVFSRRDFQEKIRQFIPVYVDGDSPGAQRIADEYRVAGYPTAVVLGSDRTEISRIAGGLDLTRYADVLDLALEQVRPVQELLGGADIRTPLDAAECRRLAYNGWLLQPDVEETAQALAVSLRQAVQRCPEQNAVERDRLLVTAAGLAAADERAVIEGAADASAAASPLMLQLLDETSTLLSSHARALRVADVLLDVRKDLLPVSHRVHPDRDATMLRDWNAVMDALESDPGYSATVQLMSAAGRVHAAKELGGGQVPQAVQDRARRTLDAFLARNPSGDERAGIMNSASWVLTYLGDDVRLRQLLEGEIRVSRTPYYYMSDLADVYERTGDKVAALTWLERGYRESRGPATRFQWGVLYVNGLLRMAPDDVARIQEAASQVLGELSGPDRIHGRTRSRLDALAADLIDWSRPPVRRQAAAAIASRWSEVCSTLPDRDPQKPDCAGRFASLRT